MSFYYETLHTYGPTISVPWWCKLHILHCFPPNISRMNCPNTLHTMHFCWHDKWNSVTHISWEMQRCKLMMAVSSRIPGGKLHYPITTPSQWTRSKRAAHTFKSPQQQRRPRRMPSPSRDKPWQETFPTDMATKDACAIRIQVRTSSATPIDQAQ